MDNKTQNGVLCDTIHTHTEAFIVFRMSHGFKAHA